MKKINNFNIPYVIIVLLIISLWTNYTNMKEIERLRYTVNDNYQMLQNDIHSISSNVRNTMEDIKKESMWIQSNDYKIIKFSEDLKYADIEISISLNEKNNNEELYIIALSNDNEKTIFDVPKSEDLNYIVNITLPTKNDYELKLTGKTTEKTRSDLINNIRLSSYIKSTISIDADLLGATYHHDSKKGDFKFYVAINKLYESKEMIEVLKDFQITQVIAEVYYGEEYIDTIDFLNEINYIPTDIEKLSNHIPELASDDYAEREIKNSIGIYKQEYFFSGKYEFKDIEDMPDIIMIVKVKDNKGNTYQEIIGHYYEYDSWYVEKMSE